MGKGSINRRNFMRLGVGAAGLHNASLELTAGEKSKEKNKGAASWSISNKHVVIMVGAETKGGLRSFVDVKTQRNFIASKPRPLYDLLLFEKGKELLVLSSLDAESFKVEHSSSPQAETLTFTYGRHRSLDLHVTCTAVLGADSPLSKWRISIKNNTSYGIRALRFPIVVAPSILGDSDEDDYYISGSWGGAITHRPSRKESWINFFATYTPEEKPRDRADFQADGGRGPSWLPIQYPGAYGVQLQAYYDKTAGLYLATHDNAGSTKSYGMTRLTDGLEISTEHNYDERPGVSFELPYDTVLGVFQGDWYAAADIYKQWAQQQHWCSKKVVERTDLPDWLKEPRPWLAVCSRGNYARLEGSLSFPTAEWPIEKLWPASKVVPLMREYSVIFNTPVVTWMEGWEYIGSPGGPVDIFPPYEGEESFKAAMGDLTRDGNHPFMYLAGLHWSYKRPMTGYDDWPRFEREGRVMAALDDHGEVMISDVVRRSFSDGQKYFAPMCTSSQEMQDLWFKNYMHLMDMGAVALQMDQQIGFYAQVCYSNQHGHAPGYGPWMYKRTLDLIRRVRGTAKQRNPRATLSVEESCELWNQELDLNCHRPYTLGQIPLFDYLYHEYCITYGGDGMVGVVHPATSQIKHAALLVNGQQNCVGIGEEEYKFEVNANYPVLKLLRNICEAQRTYARDYLVFGQMLRPPELKVSNLNADILKLPGTVPVPRIMHSAWKAPKGQIGYTLVNWTTGEETATMSLPSDMSNGNPALQFVTGKGREAVPAQQIQAGKIEVTLPPLSVLLIEQA